MDQLAERTLIRPEAIGCVEAAKAVPAQGAAAFRVQREGVQEGRAASDAEELRFKRTQGVEARGADRDAGNFNKLGAANAAILREEKWKKGAGG
jgi:hypothetical protein